MRFTPMRVVKRVVDYSPVFFSESFGARSAADAKRSRARSGWLSGRPPRPTRPCSFLRVPLKSSSFLLLPGGVLLSVCRVRPGRPVSPP
jgi:hypothetical protein